MKRCAFVSFRLGLSDGVSIVANRWIEAFRTLGWDTYTVAGDGPVDYTVEGLAIGATEPPTLDDLVVLDEADLVVVENLCTIPLNLRASRVVGRYLSGRAAIMHHHDPPWQRDRYGHITELPLRDPAWRHVTINELTREQMAQRGIVTTTIYNPFRTDELAGKRAETRREIGVDDDTLVVAHPVRAIARKNIPVALRLAEELNATYWLLGEAEEGYGEHLDWLLSTAQVPVIRQPTARIPDIYAACDVVVFPSLWEGFGNPPIEASIHRRPVIVGDYAVAEELRALGFQWFRPSEVDRVRDFLIHPDDSLLDENHRLATEKFSMHASQVRIAAILSDLGFS